MSEIVTVNLPDIGEGVVEGQVIEWLKQEGDTLTQDEPVVVIMTDKATVELPAPYPGVLSKQYYKKGQIAIKDKPLYDIEVKEAVQKKQEPIHGKKMKQEQTIAKGSENGVLATPATRKLAEELGVVIEEIKGTGPDGRVTDADVIHYHSEAPPPQAALKPKTKPVHFSNDEIVPYVGIKHAMAEKMAESKTFAPHFSFFDRAEVTRLIKLKKKVNEKAREQGLQATYLPFLIKALSLTIHEIPELNSSFDSEKGKLILHKHHNIGIAIASPSGLIVPVIQDVQEMKLEQIIRAYHDLVLKAKEEKLKREEMIHSTITISNFGSFGGRFATPILNFPEVAIVAAAKISEEVIVKNHEVVICPMMNLSWSFDHRVIDGKMAAMASQTFIRYLENPAKLL